MFLKKLSNVFNFFLPKLCIICDKNLNKSEDLICTNCYSDIDIVDQARIQFEFEKKFKEDKLISDFTSAFLFLEESKLQELIHALKYNHNYHIGKFLGKQISKISKSKFTTWKADLIIPIPLHSVKKSERGFNQAAEIAKGMSCILGIEYQTNIVKRNKFTQTQTKFTLIERKENIRDAFTLLKKKAVTGKNIILVDDVITTGATISECAKILISNGAGNVYAASAAIAN